MGAECLIRFIALQWHCLSMLGFNTSALEGERDRERERERERDRRQRRGGGGKRGKKF